MFQKNNNHKNLKVLVMITIIIKKRKSNHQKINVQLMNKTKLILINY